MATPYRDRLFGPEQDARIQAEIDNAQITGITSREQIINPYDLIDTQMYRNNAAGRALMNRHLEALKNIQSQQQASYDEWYNSAEQQALRQREAGLNPNLSDNIDAGSAAHTQVPDGNLLEGVPTVHDAVSSITGVVSTVASLASLPLSFAQLSMIPAQKALIGAQAGLATAQAGATAASASGQQLENLKSFEALIYSSAAGQFADAVAGAASAGTSFNADDFFANPDTFKGLFEAYAPEDTPQYRAAYDRAIGQVQKIKGEAYKLGGDTAQSQSAFAKALSDPYYDSNLLVQVAALEPVMKAIEDLRLLEQDYKTKLTELLDPSLEASSRNAKYKYETDYFNGFEGDKVALYEFMHKKAQAIAENASAQIYDHYHQIWKKDPESTAGVAAAYMILGKGNIPWYEFLISHGITSLDPPEYELVPKGSSSSPSPFSSSDRSYRTGTGQPNPVGPDGRRVLPKDFKWGD